MDTLQNDLWWRFIPVVLTASVTVWEVRRDKRRKTWFTRWGFMGVVAVSCAAQCGITYFDDRSRREAGEKERRRNEDSALQMNRIEGRLGSGDSTEKYLAGQRALIGSLAREKNGNAIDKYFAMADERARLRGEVQSANERVALAERMRIEPAFEFLLQKVHGWLAAAKERGIAYKLSEVKTPIVNVGGALNDRRLDVAFDDGHRLGLNVVSMAVRDGTIAERGDCFFSLLDRTGGSSRLMRIEFGEKRHGLFNERTSLFQFKDYEGHDVAPMEDKKFIDGLSDAVDEVLGFVLDEASAPRTAK